MGLPFQLPQATVPITPQAAPSQAQQDVFDANSPTSADRDANSPSAPSGGDLKSNLFKLLISGLQGAGSGLSQAMNPTGWKAAQEAKLQRDTQAAEEAREQARLKQQHDQFTVQQNREKAESDQRMKFELQKGVASGLFQEVDPATPNAIRVGDGPQAYAVRPIKISPTPTFDIAPDSDVAKSLGLPAGKGMSVDQDTWLKMVAPELAKAKAVSDKAANQQAIGKQLDMQGATFMKNIQDRFNPAYSHQLYGQSDPTAASYMKDFLNQAQTALITDKKVFGNTALNTLMSKFDNFKTPWEKARETAQARQDTLNMHAQAGLQTATDTAWDHAEKELGDFEKPIRDSNDRITRFRKNLAQKTPQGDASYGAEMLQIMAGGAASGLRLNEASIARELGSRKTLDDLKATFLKVSSKGGLIPDDQRANAGKLLDMVADRNSKKMDTILKHRDAITQADSPKAIHTQMNHFHDAYEAVDVDDSGEEKQKQQLTDLLDKLQNLKKPGAPSGDAKPGAPGAQGPGGTQ